MKVERIAIIGECMIELKKVDNALLEGFGGDTLNTAIYLSRLTNEQGVDVSYITGLGKDPFSKDMLANWQEEHINTEMVHLSDHKLPGIYTIETGADGERSFYYWRNDSAAKYWLRESDINEVIEQLNQHQLIYISGISLAILPIDCREKLIIALAACRNTGVKISFDNNYRPALWDKPEDAQKWYTKVLKLTDIAFLTYDDEEMLWGDSSEEHAIQRTQAFGVEEIVVKRGAEACFVITEKERISVSANKIDNIVDTTAAGDSFSAGYLAKRILGGTAEQSAIAGHQMAGAVIQYSGAIIPKSVTPKI